MGPGYFNRYAYTMNDPVNATDPDGREVRIAYRQVVPGVYHMALHLVPDRQDDFQGHEAFVDGRAVLSAFPSNRFILPDAGTLSAELNNPGDSALGTAAVVRTPEGLTDTQLIENILTLFSSYEGEQVPYEQLPDHEGPGRNSNGFVAGLLQASGAELPDTGLATPGAASPVSGDNFGLQGVVRVSGRIESNNLRACGQLHCE